MHAPAPKNEPICTYEPENRERGRLKKTRGARASTDCEIIAGGTNENTAGYFIRPAAVVTTNPYQRIMEEEIFGPVLSVYVYREKEYRETLQLCDKNSRYGLTGGIFTRDRKVVLQAALA